MATGDFILFSLSLLLLAALSPALSTVSLYAIEPDAIVLTDHNGTVLNGTLAFNILWYGNFSAAQRAVVTDFIKSFNATAKVPSPSVADWWNTTALYRGGGGRVRLGLQRQDKSKSLGNYLSMANITTLVTKLGHHRDAVTAVVTSPEVLVYAFCVDECGLHESALAGKSNNTIFPYIWVGDSAKQCPGQCAWPFAEPEYGPKSPPLTPPNGDIGMDGVIITLAALLAGTVTNPYGGGYYQNATGFEVATACTGIFGSGAFPGYPGQLLDDNVTGASYNAHGVAGRKFLLPALWNPSTQQCQTLV